MFRLKYQFTIRLPISLLCKPIDNDLSRYILINTSYINYRRVLYI